MRKLIPILIALVGILGGAGAGFFLRPARAPMDPGTMAASGGAHAATTEMTSGHDAPMDAPAEAAGDHAAPAEATATGSEGGMDGGDGETSTVPDYVKLSNQFVVPVVEDGRVAAMVILSLTLEVPPGTSEAIYAREPKLRDAFLQVLFDHANAGGFRGSFTDGANLVVLRNALGEVARKIMAGAVMDVLIADIVRQDN